MNAWWGIVIGPSAVYAFNFFLRSRRDLEAAEWGKVARAFGRDVWLLLLLVLRPPLWAAQNFWYWLRARDILVPIGNIVVKGQVEGRHGNVWKVRVRASHLTQGMIMQLAAADYSIIGVLMRGIVDVHIDQRGAEWAAPGGPEENAFRTVVALTENN